MRFGLVRFFGLMHCDVMFVAAEAGEMLLQSLRSTHLPITTQIETMLEEVSSVCVWLSVVMC